MNDNGAWSNSLRSDKTTLTVGAWVLAKDTNHRCPTKEKEK